MILNMERGQKELLSSLLPGSSEMRAGSRSERGCSDARAATAAATAATSDEEGSRRKGVSERKRGASESVALIGVPFYAKFDAHSFWMWKT